MLTPANTASAVKSKTSSGSFFVGDINYYGGKKLAVVIHLIM